MLTVEVAAVREETPEVRSFHLVPEPGARLAGFTAGAHVDVRIPGGDLVRQYSLTNGPDETDGYRIAVKREPDSRGGSSAMHDRVGIGDRLSISAPKNNFPLDESAPHSVLLAGGIGATPLLSMAKHLHGARRSFALHYFSRSSGLTAFRDTIEEAAWSGCVRYHHALVPPMLDDVIHRVLAERPADAQLYVCGPQPFMDLVIAAAGAAGWPKKALHLEYFSAEPLARNDDDDTFAVQIASSGATYDVPPDKSILDVLREQGVTPETSCEQGICGTCLTRVLEGAPDHRDLYLREDEQEAGDRMLICVSRARSKRLVLDL